MIVEPLITKYIFLELIVCILNRLLYNIFKKFVSGAVDSRTRQEVNMFLTAIDKNPPIMNLNGYVNVNRKLISSVSVPIVLIITMIIDKSL